MVLKFTDGKFKPQHDSTIGVEYGSKVITCHDTSIRLQIWDTVSRTRSLLGRLRGLQVDNTDIL